MENERKLEIEVNWTGSYPNLCSGEWEITIEGTKVNLPDDIVNSSMGTKGEYDTWSFGENYSEDWDSYEDGDDFEQWLSYSNGWVIYVFLQAGIVEASMEEKRRLFELIRENDWRHNSCGGCI